MDILVPLIIYRCNSFSILPFYTLGCGTSCHQVTWCCLPSERLHSRSFPVGAILRFSQMSMILALTPPRRSFVLPGDLFIRLPHSFLRERQTPRSLSAFGPTPEFLFLRASLALLLLPANFSLQTSVGLLGLTVVIGDGSFPRLPPRPLREALPPPPPRSGDLAVNAFYFLPLWVHATPDKLIASFCAFSLRISSPLRMSPPQFVFSAPVHLASAALFTHPNSTSPGYAPIIRVIAPPPSPESVGVHHVLAKIIGSTPRWDMDSLIFLFLTPLRSVWTSTIDIFFSYSF